MSEPQNPNQAATIATPPQARTIASLPSAKAEDHSSIKALVTTPEIGLATVEMKEIYADITAVEAKNVSQDSRMTTIENKNVSQDTLIAANTSKINTINNTDLKAILARLATLETKAARTIEEMFPTGYIHTQYDAATAPTLLYPKTTWTRVTTYDGKWLQVSNTAGTAVAQQLPNISGMIPGGAHNISPTGAFAGQVAGYSAEYIYAKSSTTFTDRTTFLASRSSSVYVTGGSVKPASSTIVLWRKTGSVVRTARHAIIDPITGEYLGQVDIDFDEAGGIDYSPEIHVEELPTASQASRATRAIRPGETKKVLVYDRATAKYKEVVDQRGRTAYLPSEGSRQIFELGDDLDLKAGESWDEPKALDDTDGSYQPTE